MYCELKVIAIRMLSFYHVFLKLFASMILNNNIYTYIYQFHSGTMLVSSIFFFFILFECAGGMEAVYQTELSLELCSRLAENTLIVKKLLEELKSDQTGLGFSARADFQPGLNPSPCNRQFDFKRICFSEILARLLPG